MLHALKVTLTKTLYRQLVVGVTLLLTVILSVFGWGMLARQQSQETRQHHKQVLALAKSLATSSGVWVSSRDFSGLQEIVQGVAQFPGLRYAMVLDTTGLILAHQDSDRRGQYLSDLPTSATTRVQRMAGEVTDVTHPIVLGTHHNGWVRVGVANDSFNEEFAKSRRDIVVFTLLSIVIGGLLASFTARNQTRRLRQVAEVAQALQQGHTQMRAEVTGTDEAAQLARHFNAMLDRLEDRERALKHSEALLNQSQQLGKVGGWEWDAQRASLYWTPETYRIHGLPVETDGPNMQAAVATSAACYAPEDREMVLKAFWLCAEQGVPFDLECRFVNRQQRQLWIRTRGQADMCDGKVVKVVGYIADITERKQLEEEIRHLAYFDALTGLPNRRMLTDRLQSAMATSQRSGSYGALMYLDLDNFKPLNDAHGHAVGDMLLVEVAQRLLRCVRQIDTVGRTGGDEFVVILNGLHADAASAADQAQQVASKILAALRRPYQLSGSTQQPNAHLIEHHCTATLGLCLFRGHELARSDLMKKADAAMLQAKTAGRNRIQFDATL